MNRRWIVFAVSLLVALLLAFAGAAYLTPDCEGQGCPAVQRLQAYRPPEPARVFDREGEMVAQLTGPRRIVLDHEEIPELLREGIVAVEDRRFYEHGGVDWTAGVRALFANLRAGEIEEGGSTITMQLARNVFAEEVLDYSRWHRKGTEIRLAREIESQMSKREILDTYLNQIYLGDGSHGIEAAARGYFGRSVDELSVGESALLIGLAQSPEGFNPRRAPERAVARRNTVLNILERQGVIGAEEAREARDEEMELSDPSRDLGANAYYVAAVQRQIRDRYPDPRRRAGLRIFTGLDQGWQASAVQSLASQIRAIERGAYGVFRNEAMPDDPERSTGVSPYLQGMVVAMEPADGLVRVLVGGRDFDHSEFDRAFQSRRQPGSAFKPIIYSAALSQGLRLTQEISTEPVRFAQQGSEDWQPRDHGGGEPLSVRDALTFSSNTATARVGSRIGIERVIRQARSFGLSGDFPAYPSLFLGAAEVVPAELVAAFAAFGTGGRVPEPHLITRIEDPDGAVVWRASPETRQALNPAVSYLTLSVLQDVVDRGTGWRVRSAGFSGTAAGKTGTTNDSKDAWFIGLTPDLVSGVWIGFDRPGTIVRNGTGGELAAPAWARFMSGAGQEGRSPWPAPQDVVEARVDPETGWAIPEDCPIPDARTEYFIRGTEPRPFCPIRRGGWYRTPDGDWERIPGDSLDGEWSYPDTDRRGRTIFYEGEERTRSEEERRERRRIIFGEEGERERRAPADTIRIDDDRRDGDRRRSDQRRGEPRRDEGPPDEPEDEEEPDREQDEEDRDDPPDDEEEDEEAPPDTAEASDSAAGSDEADGSDDPDGPGR